MTPKSKNGSPQSLLLTGAWRIHAFILANLVFIHNTDTVLSQEVFPFAFTCKSGSPYTWPCLINNNGSPLTLRIMYIDKPFVVTNPAAQLKIAAFGRQYLNSCDDPELAVPECFNFENWNGGWIGAFMHRVLKDLNVNVIAMTRANLSSAALQTVTDSNSTRCVWEVYFGTVDMCIGSYWYVSLLDHTY